MSESFYKWKFWFSQDKIHLITRHLSKRKQIKEAEQQDSPLKEIMIKNMVLNIERHKEYKGRSGSSTSIY